MYLSFYLDFPHTCTRGCKVDYAIPSLMFMTRYLIPYCKYCLISFLFQLLNLQNFEWIILYQLKRVLIPAISCESFCQYSLKLMLICIITTTKSEEIMRSILKLVLASCGTVIEYCINAVDVFLTFSHVVIEVPFLISTYLMYVYVIRLAGNISFTING